MTEQSKSGSSDSNGLLDLLKYVAIGIVILTLVVTLIQKPENRGNVACFMVYKASSFVYVDGYYLLSMKDTATTLEHSIKLTELRRSCIEFMADQDWLKSIPYPAFLFGED